MRPAAGPSTYTYSGNLVRSSSQLLTTTVQMFAQPDMSTSSNIETFKTNVIITFQLGLQTIYSYYDNGAQIVITENAGVLGAGLRGCTAIVTDQASPAYVLDCYIKSNQVIVRNMDYSRVISVSGEIQVIVGITNPSSASTITWTIKSYEYYIDASNYGQQIESTSTYTLYRPTGTEQMRNQIRMLPFNTKVYSTDHTPFRIAFKLSDDPPSLPDALTFDLSYNMILSGFDALSTPDNF